MTLIEMIMIAILALLILFLVYYFFRGSTGRISASRPVESRIDEYLDRRFESLIEEWSLVRKPGLQRFQQDRNLALDRDEERIQSLKSFETEMNTTLNELEGRLNALENSLGTKESQGRW